MLIGSESCGAALTNSRCVLAIYMQMRRKASRRCSKAPRKQSRWLAWRSRLGSLALALGCLCSLLQPIHVHAQCELQLLHEAPLRLFCGHLQGHSFHGAVQNVAISRERVQGTCNQPSCSSHWQLQVSNSHACTRLALILSSQCCRICVRRQHNSSQVHCQQSMRDANERALLWKSCAWRHCAHVSSTLLARSAPPAELQFISSIIVCWLHSTALRCSVR